jgi:hypothetical protein
MSKRGEGNRKKVLFFVTFLLQLTPVGGQHGGVGKNPHRHDASGGGPWNIGKREPPRSPHGLTNANPMPKKKNSTDRAHT